LKGTQSRLLEILGHDLSSESVGIVNGKGPSMGKEGDDIVLAFLANFLQHAVEFFGEGFGDTTTSALVAHIGVLEARNIQVGRVLLAKGRSEDLDGSLGLSLGKRGGWGWQERLGA
jgi:hypothetical protein